MKESIYYHKYYFTKKDFIENFNTDLTKYLNEYVDLETIDFLEFQKTQYKYALDFLDFIIDADNFVEIPFPYVNLDLLWDLMSFFNINDHKIESYKDFWICINQKKFKYSLDIFLNPNYKYLIMSWNKILNLLEGENEELDKIIKNIPSKVSLNLESKKVYDPNNFNEKCFKLFIYLSENYSKRGKIKYVNIYYFLRDKVDKNEYCFNFIQSEYTNFLMKSNIIELKKYQKAEYNYEEEVRTLNSLEQQFRAQNK